MTAPVLAIAMSLRTGSFNRKLSEVFVAAVAKAGIKADSLDLADFEMPLYHGDLEAAAEIPVNAERLRAVMAGRSVIFIASPEYNASPSPLALNTLDWLSRLPGNGAGTGIFGGTTFALGSASPGGFGGYRGLMALRQTLELGLGANVLPQMVSVGMAANAFDQTGGLVDPRGAGMVAALVAAVQRTVDIDLAASRAVAAQ